MISRIFSTASAAIFLLVIATAANAAPQYTLNFLPTGFTGAQINDVGQVVGRAGSAAALYSNGAITSVAPAPSYGEGINNQGDIAGYLAPYNEAFTYVGGVFTNIDGIVAGPNVESYGTAINELGVVGGNIFVGGEHTRGFLLHNGVVEEIGTFGGDFSPLAAINNHGAATGYAAFPGPSGGSYFHAYIYQDGTLLDLGTLGSVETDSRGTDINDLGQVVGYTNSAAFLYSGGKMIELGGLGDGGGFANALNEAGVIVGSSYSPLTPGGAGQHAFVYADGAMTDLNLLVADPGGWELTDARDINEAGQILGTACQGGSCVSVVLTPVPEPATGILLLAGMGVLAVRQRQRTYHTTAPA